MIIAIELGRDDTAHMMSCLPERGVFAWRAGERGWGINTVAARPHAPPDGGEPPELGPLSAPIETAALYRQGGQSQYECPCAAA